MAIGCIQAQHCHTDFCPAGVATQNPWLQQGLNVQDKSERFARYVQSFRKELLSLAHAAGYAHPALIRATDIDISVGNNEFASLEKVMGYKRAVGTFTTLKNYTYID